MTTAPGFSRSRATAARARLLLEHGAAREDEIRTPPSLLELGDAEREPAADHLAQVLDVAQVGLRRRTEGAQPRDVDLEPPLDRCGDPPLDRHAERVGLAHRIGDLGAAAEALAQPHRARLRLGAGDLRLERFADRDRQPPLVVGQLEPVDHPFGLAAQVDEDRVVRDLDHLARDGRAQLGTRLGHALAGRRVLLQERGELVALGFLTALHGTLRWAARRASRPEKLPRPPAEPARAAGRGPASGCNKNGLRQ